MNQETLKKCLEIGLKTLEDLQEFARREQRKGEDLAETVKRYYKELKGE